MSRARRLVAILATLYHPAGDVLGLADQVETGRVSYPKSERLSNADARRQARKREAREKSLLKRVTARRK